MYYCSDHGTTTTTGRYLFCHRSRPAPTVVRIANEVVVVLERDAQIAIAVNQPVLASGMMDENKLHGFSRFCGKSSSRHHLESKLDTIHIRAELETVAPGGDGLRTENGLNSLRARAGEAASLRNGSHLRPGGPRIHQELVGEVPTRRSEAVNELDLARLGGRETRTGQMGTYPARSPKRRRHLRDCFQSQICRAGSRRCASSSAAERSESDQATEQYDRVEKPGGTRHRAHIVRSGSNFRQSTLERSDFGRVGSLEEKALRYGTVS